MWKRFFVMLAAIFLFQQFAFAVDDNLLAKEITIQSKIDETGARLLNANKIDKRIVFAYDKADKKAKLKIDPAITSRQVILYEGDYKYIANEDELAAFLARKILSQDEENSPKEYIVYPEIVMKYNVDHLLHEMDGLS